MAKKTPPAAAGAAPSRGGGELDVATREEWRAWLAAHHDSAREIWLVFYKRHAAKSRLSYEEAVEEAICFGWVDSLVRRIDDLRYAQKFTPRKPASNWSESNRRRLAKLLAGGKMTAAGLARAPALDEPPPEPAGKRSGAQARGGASAAEPAPPEWIERALRQNERAWHHFQNLAPSHRRHYMRWIEAAKRDETRRRRLAEAVGLLEQNKKLGLK